MSQQLQQIRKKLYLHRDGASSASMKEKGINYKINFGVPVFTLRQMAKEYSPNSDLANELWENDNRELKILATLIQDPSVFCQADNWVTEIKNVELAEQIVMNLFSKLNDAESYAQKWVFSDNLYIRLTGFLIYSRLFMKDYIMNQKEEKSFFLAVFKALDHESLLIRNAAFNSLKHLGKQSVIRSKTVLANIKDTMYIKQEMKQSLLENLHFDFEDQA